MKAETNRKDVYRKALCLLIPAAGLAFLLWYIKNATCDVVYSDYIRLVNSYLPDVYDPDRFFVPDVLTRIPINYLGRIINVELFGFSITFDRVLGAVSIALAAWVFGLYFIRHKLGSIWFFLIMAVTFSLNQWEMLTNGSGWSHFFAFACFYYHELVFDRVWTGQEKKGRYPSHDPAASTYYPWNCRAVLRNLCGGNDPGFNSGNCKRPVEKKTKAVRMFRFGRGKRAGI